MKPCLKSNPINKPREKVDIHSKFWDADLISVLPATIYKFREISVCVYEIDRLSSSFMWKTFERKVKAFAKYEIHIL